MPTFFFTCSPLLDIMNRNVEMNTLSDTVKVLELNWSWSPSLHLVLGYTYLHHLWYLSSGSPLPEDLPQMDVILAADCVYFEPAFPLLVQTLKDLANASSTCEFLFCYKKRRKARYCFFSLLWGMLLLNGFQADKRFFTLLKKEFSWEEVGIEWLYCYMDADLGVRLWMIPIGARIRGKRYLCCDWYDEWNECDTCL